MAYRLGKAFPVRSRTIPALAAALIGALAPAAQGQTAPAGGGTSVLRIACEGASAGAEITINGAFKGECPFDTAVPAGTMKLRAFKASDPLRESVLEQEFKVGEGIVKRIDIELPEPQLTARGRQLQEAWVKEQEAEKAQAAAELALAEERRRQAVIDAEAAKKAKARADIDQVVDAFLAQRRAKHGTADAPCPDCPLGMPPGTSIALDTPRLSDPALQAMLAWSKQGLQGYIASRGANLGPPSQKQPLPCPEAEFQLRKLAGFLDFSELSETERSKKLNSYTDPNQEDYFRDVQFWPVQATCVDGLLDGSLEYWIFSNFVSKSTSISNGVNYIIAEPTLVHVQATMTAGNVSGVISEMKRKANYIYAVLRPASEWVDQYTNHQKESIRFSQREPGEIVTAKYVALYAEPMLLANGEAETIATTVHIPKGNGIYSIEHYIGSKLMYRKSANKNGRHGAAEFFDGSFKETVCFRDDVKVESKSC